MNTTLIDPCYLVKDIDSNERIETVFGVAKVNKRGYYQMTSHNKQCSGRMLHRLIVEKFYQIQLPTEWHVHHANGNKLDNRIVNLHILHGKKHQEVHSKEKEGKPLPLDTKLMLSYQKNSSGYFRVKKHKDDSCKQGFIWRYSYYEDNKRKGIESVDLDRLEQKVKDKGLIWRKL